jgi:hypothetical protein
MSAVNDMSYPTDLKHRVGAMELEEEGSNFTLSDQFRLAGPGFIGSLPRCG